MHRLLILVFLGLSACSTFSRDPRTGYADDDGVNTPAPTLYEQRQAVVEDEAREELGYGSRPLSDDERPTVENRIRLKRMEMRIPSKREKKQYYSIRSALPSDNDRIYFLSLPTFEARERWAAQRGLSVQEDGFPEDVAKTIDANDIQLGMSQKAVMQSWGDPDVVEVAGNPVFGYERWKYNRYISGNDGYQKEQRVVFFEGGQVVGWERPK
jgi:hypothetical protein